MKLGVTNQLAPMMRPQSLFKNMTNFTVEMFEELMILVCPVIRPFQDPEHSRWFNGRKKMYAVNNTVIVDHDGLFIFVDPIFPGSFHDITILRHSEVHAKWPDYLSIEMIIFSLSWEILGILVKICIYFNEFITAKFNLDLNVLSIRSTTGTLAFTCELSGALTVLTTSGNGS